MPPTPWRHAQHTDYQTDRKSGEHDQNHRAAPLVAEKEMQAGVVLVVQRKRKQGKEYARLQYPFE